jgi:hypothetical protein
LKDMMIDRVKLFRRMADTVPDPLQGHDLK